MILDLRDSNDEVFNERRSFYRKKVRDDLVAHGNALFVLHSSAKATLSALKEADKDSSSTSAITCCTTGARSSMRFALFSGTQSCSV